MAGIDHIECDYVSLVGAGVGLCLTKLAKSSHVWEGATSKASILDGKKKYGAAMASSAPRV